MNRIAFGDGQMDGLSHIWCWLISFEKSILTEMKTMIFEIDISDVSFTSINNVFVQNQQKCANSQRVAYGNDRIGWPSNCYLVGEMAESHMVKYPGFLI